MLNLWNRLIASKLTVLFTGVAAGAVTAPLLGRAARPLVLGLVKARIVVQQEILQLAARMREELEDITAEAKHELGERPAHVEHPHDDGHRQDRVQA
jgi:hypothetical protein